MTAEKSPTTAGKPAKGEEPQSRWFSLPAPIRRVFDSFPLRTYSTNDLPQRSPSLKRRSKNILYIFKKTQWAGENELSSNPACLKWQAYLKFSGIAFETTFANNHASPTGSLPFLLPAANTLTRPSSPVPASKISKWVTAQSGSESLWTMQKEAYSVLLDHSIRNAWLYTLYLDDANFNAVARPMYIHSASSYGVVQTTLAYQLRQAARAELLKSSVILDEEELHARADEAFEALSVAIGSDETFSGDEQPDLLDAAVFAYTHPLLDEDLKWQNPEMAENLRKYKNLVEHRERMMERYFRAE